MHQRFLPNVLQCCNHAPLRFGELRRGRETYIFTYSHRAEGFHPATFFALRHPCLSGKELCIFRCFETFLRFLRPRRRILALPGISCTLSLHYFFLCPIRARSVPIQQVTYALVLRITGRVYSPEKEPGTKRLLKLDTKT